MIVRLEITDPQDATLILQLVKRMNIAVLEEKAGLVTKETADVPILEQRQGFGSWKGIHLEADFDASLEEFNEYME